MRQQTKPFIVEIKQSRKLKPATQKPSIWGTLDLSVAEDQGAPAPSGMEPADTESGGRL
ncbi:hypothetical protein [Rhizobium sp. RU36D]|uniref:hypothetical protein n=1 Tax=Rhizobium sp. RU36D TaxID=1907415 RepID=UPI0009D8B341|nr:hypothetical protein [Rhizobium sp. RU36D]SMD13021.1 hypothetical protein SAMN05880593_12483 [Rhizobium sp. RU36D]